MEDELKRAIDFVIKDVPADERELFGKFAEQYFPAIPKRYRNFLEGNDLGQFLLARWSFLKLPLGDEALVRITNPDEKKEGWNSTISVLEARQQDRPFIVDSIKEHLHRKDVEISITIHPVLVVERDAKGRVKRIDSARSEGTREANVYLHFPRIHDEAQREELARELREILQMGRAAVDDYPLMAADVRDLANQLVEKPKCFPGRLSTQQQKKDFFLWLLDGNFTFLGMRRHKKEADGFKVVPKSLRGLFRPDGVPPAFLAKLNADVQRDFEFADQRAFTMTVSRLSTLSPVHRAAEMDYITVRRRDEKGNVAEVTEIIGLYTTSALLEKPHRIPLIKDKIADVVSSFGYIENSHKHKTIVSIVSTLPKEFLFNSSKEDLVEEVDTVLSAEDGEDVLVSLRYKPKEARLVATLRMPEANYSVPVRERVLERIAAVVQPQTMRDYHWSGEGDVSRLHVYAYGVSVPKNDPQLNALSEELEEMIRTWQERLMNGIEGILPGTEGKALARKYVKAFPAGYQGENDVESALYDIRNLERFAEGHPVVVGMYHQKRADGAVVSEVRLYKREKVHLSAIMPVLSNLGMTVVEERTNEVHPASGHGVFVHAFLVRTRTGEPIPDASSAEVAVYLARILMGQADSDPLNGLVLAAGLDWRGADLLLTYRNLMLQIRRTSSIDAANGALLGNPEAAKMLYQLFESRLSPDLTGSRQTAIEAAAAAFDKQLEKVASINADRILRSMRQLVDATLRTNFYLDKPHESRCISVKINSSAVAEMPDPKPYAEIYVHGPGVEAVHLRGGKVARGGLRWSDRPDDFRTEILGLMKTQMVKNVVIVPVGSKGGFVLKRQFADRKAQGEEMVRQYTVFMQGLLDITDNLVKGKLERNPRVVCHDDEDPYLVVAADKGTANMSDTANSISRSYGFWLDDAFASGGSAGYSHKAMGITAKGGWECVKRHFREMGVDMDRTVVSVVGIGDMSGDVFGNGMLLSRKLKLLAAFDHRHIFIDPDPDPEKSFLERERMFSLPSSSWADYKTDLISKGGGVFPRGSKRIKLSPEARKALGIETEIVNSDELIRGILKAPVDLLWNGGIGTYIKCSRESNLDVGDKTNDEVRINGQDVRAKVIGEGGNLGLTQFGRIEYAKKGGRCNTDAIDNSGGVDCSDHEVNLKILFKLLLEEKKIADEAERNKILFSLTDEIAAHVLRNNFLQSALISQDELRSKEDVEPFIRLATFLAKQGALDRTQDRIPSDEDLRAAHGLGHPIARPVLAVLTGWAKKVLYDIVLASDLPDRPENQKYFIEYFPAAIWQRYGEVCFKHRLRREIIATCLINRITNQAGIADFLKLSEESGDPIPEALRIYMAVNDLLEADRLRAEIHSLDNKVPARLQYQELIALDKTIHNVAHRMLRGKRQQDIGPDLVARYTPEVRELKAKLREHVSDDLRSALVTEERALVEQGFPTALAQEMAAIRYLKPVFTMVRIREATKTSLSEVAGLWYRIGNQLFLHYLLEEIDKVALRDEWDRELHAKVSRELAVFQRRLTTQIIGARRDGEGLHETVERFLEEHKKSYKRLKTGVTRLKTTGVTGLVPVQVLKECYEEML